MNDYYDKFLEKYPDLQVHLSILSEELKNSKKIYDIEDWQRKILDYIQFQNFNFDKEVQIQFSKLLNELDNVIDIIYIFKYVL